MYNFYDYTFRLSKPLKSGILNWRYAVRYCKVYIKKTDSECTEISDVKWLHSH